MGNRAEVGARGFTLLELLVTLFLVALALALVAPALGRTSDTVRARAEVAGFSAVLRHAREQAITTRQAHTVVVDPAAHRLTITTGDDEVRRTRALPTRLVVEAVSRDALAMRFEPHGASSGGEFRLTSGGITYRVSVDPITGRVRNTRE
ncbi:MAG: GspH/FimT family protein [Candidatus Rokubacteria bacterium]|nr:GspH/FimT family protein [Candidatus Rokubacteria bacterium]MBI2017147.1 GspH/FimT family protein [Candidatus Rokubacteria bacterium]MBI2157347.1 GspH/FimT family protein [Candidatus Rokubacteria bacterium]MBI2493592.1 GspH/FimT family protein [Candidatus Rokubacteria bacterium]MBI4254426.1 GspH/FimT family protein [Candidatus Rokubacteria bacterium]